MRGNVLLSALVGAGLLAGAVGPAARAEPQAGPRGAMNVSVRQTELRDVLLVIARHAKANILISPQVKGKATLELHDIAPLRALSLVARINGYKTAVVQGVVCVGTKDDILNLRDGGEWAVEQLRHARSSDMAAMVSKLYKDLDIVEDPRTNTIIIAGPRAR